MQVESLELYELAYDQDVARKERQQQQRATSPQPYHLDDAISVRSNEAQQDGRRGRVGIPTLPSDETPELTSSTPASAYFGRSANELINVPIDTDAQSIASGPAALPPIDGGKQAWMFLVGAFAIEMICMGGAFTFSIFQDFLVKSPASPLISSSSSSAASVSNVSVSAIGTLLVSLTYLSPSLCRGIWSRFAKWNRLMGVASTIIAGLSLLAASFCRSEGSLLVFMGALPGTFLGLATLNYMVWLPQWFLRRRSLANGLAFAGAGTGGIVYPFIVSASLRSLGFEWTMQIWAAMVIALGSAFSILVKPRLPVQDRRTTVAETASARHSSPSRGPQRLAVRWLRSLAFLRSPLLLLNILATFVNSMGFFAVSFYLATYCSSIGLSSSATTGMVAAFNAAALCGEILAGNFCDRFSYARVAFVMGVVSTLSSFLLFGLAQSKVGVVFFVLLFGLSGGSWCALWTPAAYDVARLFNTQSADVLLALVVPRGVASACGPLVAAALYQPEDNTKHAIFGAYGFDDLIIFVGLCMAMLIPFAPVVEWMRKKQLASRDPATLRETF